MNHQSLEQQLQAAIAHHHTGALEQAESLYRLILSRHPNQVDALHLLGLIAHQTGRNELAAQLIHQALVIKPDLPEANYNLGLALSANGDLDGAMVAYRQAIALRPQFARAFNSLGNALMTRGRADEAATAFGQAIAVDSAFADARFNLGNALRSTGKVQAAIAAYREVLSLNPNRPDAAINLANTLFSVGELDASINAFRRAIALRPGTAALWNNLGIAMFDAGQAEQAIAAFGEAITLEPTNASFASARLSAMHYSADPDAFAIAQEHFRWNTQYAEPLSAAAVPHIINRDAARRLRVGYVSADFRNHPVGRFMLPLIENHDRAQFDVFLYSDVKHPDAITARFRASGCERRDISKLDHEVAAGAIRRDAIDILVDLSGHTAGNRLMVFARRPAQVQVSYLGYPATTGLSAMDYRLTDAWADPPGLTEHLHSEVLIRLPETNWCYAESAEFPTEPIPRDHVCFGSFNNFTKVTDSMLSIWARILRAVPGSGLVLKAGAFTTTSATSRVRDYFIGQRIRPDRVTLLGPSPSHADHLAGYGRIDIALDTFPYHGTATTCEALWMGVPVITLAGVTHVSRVGVSLLNSVGLPDLIAMTPDNYVELAVELAKSRSRLDTLRTVLRGRMQQSPLTDSIRFTAKVESAFRSIWHMSCKAAQ